MRGHSGDRGARGVRQPDSDEHDPGGRDHEWHAGTTLEKRDPVRADNMDDGGLRPVARSRSEAGRRNAAALARTTARDPRPKPVRDGSVSLISVTS